MRAGRCPPGVMCISPGVIVFGFIIAFVSLAVWMLSGPQRLMAQPVASAGGGAAFQPQPIAVQVATNLEGGDDRYTRAPKPERAWLAKPDLEAIGATYGQLPAVPTRGLPESYQSMGVITVADGQILPLYGRRTASRSDRFQYYTRTDSYNPVPLPIQAKGRSCQDDVGCSELMDGDTVKVVPLNQTGPVTIYRFNGPTYYPGVL